jgi:hypothetical protein
MKSAPDFLSAYPEPVYVHALELRDLILSGLPDVIEQVDLPARMVAYVYGQKYTDMICTIIPSQKGLKLGFYKGPELPDPDKLLQGNGKISRYVEIKSTARIQSPALRKLIRAALEAYRLRAGKKD